MRSSQGFPSEPLTSLQLDQQLSRYALAAAAAGVGILALGQPAEAEVVYTPTHQQIAPNTTINLDLNNDGITDFQLKDTFSTTFFSSFGRFSVLPMGKQNQISGHTVSARAYASAFFSNAVVGPKGQFLPAAGMMADLSFLGGAHHPPASVSCTAPWANVGHRYLGLKFIIKGEVHFGWARLNVSCARNGSQIAGLLTGYAYETLPNVPVLTGREKGIEDTDAVTTQPASLGQLAQGAAGLSAWRGKQ